MLPNGYSRNDGIGLRRDTLIDARGEADNAQHALRSAASDLDAILDTRDGIWHDDEAERLREIQQELWDIADSKEDDIEEINTELVDIKQEEQEAEQ